MTPSGTGRSSMTALLWTFLLILHIHCMVGLLTASACSYLKVCHSELLNNEREALASMVERLTPRETEFVVMLIKASRFVPLRLTQNQPVSVCG